MVGLQIGLGVTKLMEKSNSIKIIFGPFAIIFLVLSTFVLAGFIWDNIRTKEKLEKLSKHSERIYAAHVNDFIEIAKLTDPEKSGALLEQINALEQGVYAVHVLRKTATEWKIFSFKYPLYRKEISLPYEQAQKIEKTVDANNTVSISSELFDNLWLDKKSLHAFTPIKEGGTLLGYVVVQLSKTKNI